MSVPKLPAKGSQVHARDKEPSTGWGGLIFTRGKLVTSFLLLIINCEVEEAESQRCCSGRDHRRHCFCILKVKAEAQASVA